MHKNIKKVSTHPFEDRDMNLETLYFQIKESLSGLDFEKIWPGFSPLKFALFNQNQCFFNGQYIEKTDDFCANTSICYQGEQIAIWMADEEEIDLPVLTSKIVHEMFHGFQQIQGWDCWANEMEALYRYQYNAENLGYKLRENELLLELLEHFEKASFHELLLLRKFRHEKYPYEFLYEIRVEEIEGTANYVEWQTLKQLDSEKALSLAEDMRVTMTKPESLFPIRISSYYTGALLVNALIQAGIDSFHSPERPVILSAIRPVDLAGWRAPENSPFFTAAKEAIDAFNRKSAEIIQSAVSRNEIVLQGDLKVVCVNIYDARCYQGYLTSRYFLMYQDGEERKTIEGDFVIHMKDEKMMDKVFRWE